MRKAGSSLVSSFVYFLFILPQMSTFTSTNSFFLLSAGFDSTCSSTGNLPSYLCHILALNTIKVRVSSPLKPSPTFESASLWRGNPDNKGSGHRKAAVRRDQIR